MQAGLGVMLVALARSALEAWVRGQRRVAVPAEPPVLAERRPAFVTLWKAGDLRGCMGHPVPRAALGETLVSCAIAAASEDPRFDPVRAAELADIRVEVSVLTPPRRVRADEVQAGRHGVIVSHNGRRGLLLPQVAAARGWDPETLLAQTCRKAGLGADAWKQGATIEVFEAEVFEEDRVPAEDAASPRPQ